MPCATSGAACAVVRMRKLPVGVSGDVRRRRRTSARLALLSYSGPSDSVRPNRTTASAASESTRRPYYFLCLSSSARCDKRARAAVELVGQAAQLALRAAQRAELALEVVAAVAAAQLVERGGIDEVAQHRGVAARWRRRAVPPAAAAGVRPLPPPRRAAAAAGAAAAAAAAAAGRRRRREPPPAPPAAAAAGRRRPPSVPALLRGVAARRRDWPNVVDATRGERRLDTASPKRSSSTAPARSRRWRRRSTSSMRCASRCTSRRSLSPESRSRSALSCSSRGPSSGSSAARATPSGLSGAASAAACAVRRRASSRRLASGSDGGERAIAVGDQLSRAPASSDVRPRSSDASRSSSSLLAFCAASSSCSRASRRTPAVGLELARSAPPASGSARSSAACAPSTSRARRARAARRRAGRRRGRPTRRPVPASPPARREREDHPNA